MPLFRISNFVLRASGQRPALSVVEGHKMNNLKCEMWGLKSDNALLRRLDHPG